MKLKTFLAGYGIKKVSDFAGISCQSSQTLRNWLKSDTKRQVVKCCALAYHYRLANGQPVNQEFDSKGFDGLNDYLESEGMDMATLESTSNQSYQTLSNWFLNPKKSCLIGVILDAVKWIKVKGDTNPHDREMKRFELERVVKDRKSFKGKYY